MNSCPHLHKGEFVVTERQGRVPYSTSHSAPRLKTGNFLSGPEGGKGKVGRDGLFPADLYMENTALWGPIFM